MKRKTIFMLFAMMLFAVQQISAEIKTGNYGEGYDGKVASNVTFSLDTETGILTLSGSGNMKHWESCTTTKGEGEDLRNFKQYIKRVVFADGSDIKNIGHWAFYKCDQLESVTIPTTVTALAISAFEGCTKLNNVTIPYSVTNICENAFKNCSGLFNLTINRIGDFAQFDKNAFEGMPTNGTVYYPYGYGEDDYKNSAWYTNGDNDWQKVLKNCTWTPVFYESRSLVYTTTDGSPLTLSSYEGFGATKFGDFVHPDDNNKRCIIFYEDVTSIPADAFKNQTKLTSISLPSTAASLGNNAFQGCSSLASITLPSKATSLGNNAFQGCSNLASINIPSGVTSLGNYAFQGCSNLASISLPSSMKSLGNNAFQGCSNLAGITIPSSLNSLGTSAFDGCAKVTTITLPAGVTSIGEYTFNGCSALSSFAMQGNVTTIGAHALDGCSSLTIFTFPASVTSIGDAAFNNCEKLSDITIKKATNVTLGENVFGGSTPSEGVVHYYFCENNANPAWWTNTSNKLQGWDQDEIFDQNHVIEYVSEGDDMNPAITLSQYKDKNGVYQRVQWSEFGTNINKIADIQTGGKKRYVVFDGNVTKIPANAFNGNKYLRSIVLPPSVTTIEDYAFYASKVEAITLSKNLTQFCSHSFELVNAAVRATSMVPPTISGGNTSKINVFGTYGTKSCLFVPMGSESAYEKKWSGTWNPYQENFEYVPYTDFSVSSEAKWGTCILTFKYDLPTGVKAYKCTSINSNGYLVLTDETSTIQPNTPYILYAENGYGPEEIYGDYYGWYNDTFTYGKLTGVIKPQTVTSNASTYRYVLQNHDDEGVKFYKIAQGVNHTVKQGRCYLTLSAAEASSYNNIRGFGFDLFDNTAVSAPKAVEKADGPIYDLQGRQVKEMEVGRIYVVNGQKILKIK